MAYCVITKQDENEIGGLPTVISQNDKNFPTFIMAGYEIVYEGCRRACEIVAEEMLSVFCIE